MWTEQWDSPEDCWTARLQRNRPHCSYLVLNDSKNTHDPIMNRRINVNEEKSKRSVVVAEAADHEHALAEARREIHRALALLANEAPRTRLVHF